jgi:NhaA family Na+:H+ antiporter
MVVPALIYFAINRYQPYFLKGWAIPVATDIAFALGVLSMLGRRVSLGLKLFLMSLAIFDDLGAIIIIAIFYGHDFSFSYLILSGLLLILITSFPRLKIDNKIVYGIAGILLWFLVMRSGIHPTIAGILLACVMPIKTTVEKALQPWVIFGIVPVFAFLNAGLPWPGWATGLDNGIVWGTVLGLFLGKQLGVFSCAWLAIKSGVATLPEHTSWRALYGASVLCGIGFTMSLFIGTLTFEKGYLDQARLGILIGSLLSGLLGTIILYSVSSNRQSKEL